MVKMGEEVQLTEENIKKHFAEWTNRDMSPIIEEIDPWHYLSRDDLTLRKLVSLVSENPEVIETFTRKSSTSEKTRKFMLAVKKFKNYKGEETSEFESVDPETDF